LRDADNIQKEVRATADKIYPDIVWRSEVYLNKGANCVRVAARFRDDQGERKTPPKGHLAINEAEVIVLNRFYVTLRYNGSAFSHPLREPTISWDDKLKRLKLIREVLYLVRPGNRSQSAIALVGVLFRPRAAAPPIPSQWAPYAGPPS